MTLERLKKGRKGEDLAVDFIRKRGYQILERNYRCSLGEIDIIAEDGDTLCFIEVRAKSGSRLGHPFESITSRKKRSISRTAQYFLTSKELYERKARFDVIGIQFQDTGPSRIELIRNAFDVS